jgi:hypothetical protein
MKTAIKLATAFAVATACATTPAFAEKPAELSATELTAIQAHNYQVPSDVAFKSVIAALQTLGYVDINASKDAGTVTAVTEAKAKIIYNILWGFGKKKLTQKASLLVEDQGGAGSTVRLNLLVAETKARGIFGTSFSDGKMVKTADPYNQFFTALDAEVARRAAVAAAATPAPAAAVVADAAAEAPAVGPAQAAVAGAPAAGAATPPKN